MSPAMDNVKWTDAAMDNDCEFCEIDGYGNHAPRCPEYLEAEIKRLKRDRDNAGLAAERMEAGMTDMVCELNDVKAELQRLREIADELVYWWDNYGGTRAFFPGETTKRLKSVRDRLVSVKSTYRPERLTDAGHEGSGNADTP